MTVAMEQKNTNQHLTTVNVKRRPRQDGPLVSSLSAAVAEHS